MLEEIRNNKFTIILIIVLFLILEIQLAVLSTPRVEKLSEQSPKASPAAASLSVPQETTVTGLFGKVKSLKGSELKVVLSESEIQVKITSDTKILRQDVNSPDDQAEIELADIKTGDMIIVSSGEEMRGKTSVEATSIILMTGLQ